MTLTPEQSTILRLVAAYDQAGCGWVPRFHEETVERQEIRIDPRRYAPALRALIRKRLLRAYNLGFHPGALITEDGRQVAQEHRGKPLAWKRGTDVQPDPHLA